ncbi:permease [Hapalosiphon sp. MRB220]|nr:permease [Hapalosiphon sp. MRB220]
MSQSSKPSFWQNLNNSTLLRLLLIFACGWALVILISYFYNVIAIFTTAAIIAALLNYPVQWLSRYIPRGLAITITFLGAVVILIALVTALGLEVLNQGQSLVDRITQAVKTQDLLPLKELIGNLNLARLLQTLQTGLISGLGIAQNIFSSIFTLIFLAVISLYMLIDGEKVWLYSLQLIPANSRDRFATTFKSSFLGFLLGQLLLILFLSIASFIVFLILGVNYALFLALIVGILDAIPGIGATLGVLTITVLVLASQGWVVAVQVVIACIILQQIQDNFISPKVMGNTLEISPVLLFLALFIGERVAGLLGIFLSIPIAGMIAAWLRTGENAQQSLPERSP